MAGITSAAAVAVVLVHGGFVDGSGWEDVYKILKKDGYNVSIVQNPTSSLADDVAATKRVLAEQTGPVILVGHSYGGAVITEAGNDPRVSGLVYIAAFAPDKGESVATLIKDPQPGAPVSVSRQGEVRRFLRGRRGQGKGRVHGQLADSLGPGRPQRRDQRAGMEEQAELVPGRHRRQDDSACGPAFHVQARWLDRCRGQGQSRGLCVEAKRSGRANRNGSQGCESSRELGRGQPGSWLPFLRGQER